MQHVAENDMLSGTDLTRSRSSSSVGHFALHDNGTLCRALPPVAAAIQLLHGIQQFLDPYVRRYQEIRETVDVWWEVREERWPFFPNDAQIQGTQGAGCFLQSQPQTVDDKSGRAYTTGIVNSLGMRQKGSGNGSGATRTNSSSGLELCRQS